MCYELAAVSRVPVSARLRLAAHHPLPLLPPLPAVSRADLLREAEPCQDLSCVLYPGGRRARLHRLTRSLARHDEHDEHARVHPLDVLSRRPP